MRRVFVKKDMLPHNWGVFWRRFGRITGFLILLSVSSFGLYFVFIEVFTIRVIEVVGDPIKIEVDAHRFTRNLLLFPSTKVKKQILSQYPQLSSVSITKKLPSTLQINVTLRQAVAAMQTKSSLFLLDDRGVVIFEGTQNSASLPTIFYDTTDSLVPGKVVDNRAVQKSLVFIQQVGLFASVSALTVDASGIVRAQIDQSITIFDQDTDISQLGHTLQTLLNRFRMKGTLPTTIDLRFEKPVVGF